MRAPSKPAIKKSVKEVEAVQEVDVHEETTQEPVQSEPTPKPEKSTPPVIEAPSKTETPEPITKKDTPVAAKPKEVVPSPETSNIKYFIQVGSYRQTPSKRFLSVIKNNGFAYHIGMGRTVEKALRQLKHAHIETIDSEVFSRLFGFKILPIIFS